TISKWWTVPACRHYALRYLGFSRPVKLVTSRPPRYPFSTLEQLVGFRLYVLLEPALCKHEEPMFGGHVQSPLSLKPWNSELLRWRFRVDEVYDCPQGHPYSFPCQRCPYGYLETCSVGTHAYDHVNRPCPVCGEAEAPFDVERSETMCVTCHTKKEEE